MGLTLDSGLVVAVSTGVPSLDSLKPPVQQQWVGSWPQLGVYWHISISYEHHLQTTSESVNGKFNIQHTEEMLSHTNFYNYA